MDEQYIQYTYETGRPVQEKYNKVEKGKTKWGKQHCLLKLKHVNLENTTGVQFLSKTVF